MAAIYKVIPLLVYKDIPVAHDFLVKAFGFEAGGIERDAEGRPIHGEVRAGDVTIWLHRAAVEHRLDSQTATSGGLVVHVDDVDTHCKLARAAGALIESEPQNQPYGQREYGARDPEGHRWWFATPYKSLPGKS